MTVWMHRKTGELALVRSIWVEAEMPINTEYTIQLTTARAGIAFENKHGVVFVVPIKILEQFEELGDL